MEDLSLHEKNLAIQDCFATIANYLKSKRSKDKCHSLLIGLSKLAQAINEPVLASNFELYWQETKNNMRPYCDPANFRFYELEIEMKLKKSWHPLVWKFKNVGPIINIGPFLI